MARASKNLCHLTFIPLDKATTMVMLNFEGLKENILSLKGDALKYKNFLY